MTCDSKINLLESKPKDLNMTTKIDLCINELHYLRTVNL